jgi:hypothetical protein
VALLTGYATRSRYWVPRPTGSATGSRYRVAGAAGPPLRAVPVVHRGQADSRRALSAFVAGFGQQHTSSPVKTRAAPCVCRQTRSGQRLPPWDPLCGLWGLNRRAVPVLRECAFPVGYSLLAVAPVAPIAPPAAPRIGPCRTGFGKSRATSGSMRCTSTTECRG